MKSTDQLKENLDELKEISGSHKYCPEGRNYAESAIEEAEGLSAAGRVACASNSSTKALGMLND